MPPIIFSSVGFRPQTPGSGSKSPAGETGGDCVAVTKESGQQTRGVRPCQPH